MSTSSLKIISGGQTGADQAALFAARKCGLATGGWAPKDYLTLSGPAPWLAEYGLVEMSSSNYVARSITNVQNSDATLAFRKQIIVPSLSPSDFAPPHTSSGTDKTIGYALTKKWVNVDLATPTTYKPVCIVSDVHSVEQQQKVVEFIRFYNVKVLNVCGHRETDMVRKEWTLVIENFLVGVFSKLN